MRVCAACQGSVQKYSRLPSASLSVSTPQSMVDAADHRRAGARRGGVVGYAEGHRFEPFARLRNGLDIGHTERGLDQHFEADALRALHRGLDLGHHHVERVHVGGHARLRDQNHVQPRAGFDDIDHVAVHVVRVETVDADHHGLRAPVNVIERLNDVFARLCLVVGRDRILDVEKDDVGGGLCGLLE
jgi:hypothetical protein